MTDSDNSLVSLFTRAALRNANRTAVVAKDGNMSYSDLLSFSGRIAQQLQIHGVSRGEIIGLYASRTAKIIGAMLGILRAGAAYLPLQPEDPVERCQMLSLKSSLRFIIHDGNHPFPTDKDTSVRFLSTADLTHDGVKPLDLPEIPTTSLAYTLYTSGSTGTPKGVMIEHRNVVALLEGFNRVAPHHGLITGTCVCPMSFDVSVWEIFSVLCFGGTLYLLDSNIDTLGSLGVFLGHSHTTNIYIPPGLIDEVALQLKESSEHPPLQRVLVGVEPITQKSLQAYRDMFPNTYLINGYGPTETTICATLYPFIKADSPLDRVPIGKAIEGYEVLLVDNNLKPVQPGDSGEIIIGGKGVARGYLNNEEETSSRFFSISLPGISPSRFYRTGDFGRILPSGNIEFLDRQDNQIKIRGRRVELGEVAHHLSSCAAGSRAVVKVFGQGVEKKIVGFVERIDIPEASLRILLATKLPDYMLPASIITVEKFPTTSHGKIDLVSLERFWNATQLPVTRQVQSHEEELFCEVWHTLFPESLPNMQAHFTESGGNSLAAIRLANRLAKRFHTIVKPTELFRAPTLRDFLTLLAGKKKTLVENKTQQLESVKIPLTEAQKGLWAFQQLNPANSSFVLRLVYRLQGAVDTEKLNLAFSRIVSKHESLRTFFIQEQGIPFQQVQQEFYSMLAIEKVSSVGEVHKAVERMAVQTLDLPLPPIKHKLFYLNESEYYLVIAVHHLIFDGWSERLFLEELFNAYYGQMKEIPHSGMRELALQQLEGFDSDSVKFWKTMLNNWPAPLDLPTDLERMSHRTGSGASHTFRLDRELSGQLKKFALSSNTTEFVLLCSTLISLLYRYTNQSDIVIAFPYAQRQTEEQERSIGYFVNLLPLRTQFSHEPSFDELVSSTRDQLSQLLEHAEYPFEKMLEFGPRERSSDITPLARVVIAQDLQDYSPMPSPEFILTPQPIDVRSAKYELALFFSLQEEITLRWEFSSELFFEGTICRLSDHFTNLLRAAISDPKLLIGDLQMLCDWESRFLLEEVNDTTVPYPRNQGIHQLFSAKAKDSPQAIAVESEKRKVTYQELDTRSDSLAKQLVTLRLPREAPVFAVLDRSHYIPIALLGILKAGATYIPIDAKTPSERIMRLYQLLSPKCIVTDSRCIKTLPEMGVPIIAIESTIEANSKKLLLPNFSPGSLAYIMFTSGSTGEPKCIGIPHHAIARLVLNTNIAALDNSDRFLHVSNFSFDAATFEIWGSLLNGGKLVIPSEATLKDPSLLCQAVAQHGITVGFFTVSLFSRMLKAAPELLQTMHTILVGGEAVPSELLRNASQVLAPEVLLNGYGPTENTTFSCCYRLSEPPSGRGYVPIGRPISNSQVYITDDKQRLVPFGVVGEILLGGDGLARSYLNDGELTQKKFLSHPFPSAPGQRVYRTGDYGKMLPDGSVLFLGRQDDQVKIRGFRVELGEVEAELLKLPKVTRATVKAPWNNGVRQLVAFIETEGDISEIALKVKLQQCLPEFMIPARLVVLQKFPLNANGKVDTQKLLDLLHLRPDDQPLIVRPSSYIELRLTQMWKEVLKVDEISIDDNFFDLGGDSILILVLRDKIMSELQLSLSSAILFANPNIRSLARYIGIDSRTSENSETILSSRIERRLTALQERRLN